MIQILRTSLPWKIGLYNQVTPIPIKFEDKTSNVQQRDPVAALRKLKYTSSVQLNDNNENVTENKICEVAKQDQFLEVGTLSTN